MFGLHTSDGQGFHIYEHKRALILPPDSGPGCPLVSAILFEQHGYSWFSNHDKCQLTTPDGFTINLKRDSISGFWFLLCVTSDNQHLDDARRRLIKQSRSMALPVQASQTDTTLIPPKAISRKQIPVRIPRPNIRHLLPKPIERILELAHVQLGHTNLRQ